MKRFIVFVFALSMMALSSCDDDLLVDWYPVNLYLKVTDGNGTDLLDPENPDNMIDGTTITFRGKTYEASRERLDRYAEPERLDTRAYLATLYGLFLISDKEISRDLSDGYSLIFGEIDGAVDMDEDLVVTLPDGTKGTIHYHCSDHNDRKGKCNRYWKFNGVRAESNRFTFVVSR